MELSSKQQKVINLYVEGSTVDHIANALNTDTEKILSFLIKFKEGNRFKKTFTDDFKKIIAQRDMTGVSRKSISTELKLNSSTVKKACEQFGQSFKDKPTSENIYTVINGEFSKEECPTCNSRRVNEIEDNTIYCISCGNEFIYKDDHVLKINWEYLGE